MHDSFREIFKQSDGARVDQRAKFLSRLFGIFSEKIVDVWARDERAPYEGLGRPKTLKLSRALGRKPEEKSNE